MNHKIITVKDIPLSVEIADTQESRQQGLMHRNNLEQGSGMLFIFDDSQSRGFWMKDTSIPLSIAFISDTGEILNIENMYPYDSGTTRSNGPAQCALEVNQGWFRNNGIHSGDKVNQTLNESFYITKRQIGDILKRIVLG
jgi:uncharacterized membrane protein (UPF0127 family)